MTTIDQFKAQAAKLGGFLAAKHGLQIKHTHCLHALAVACGNENWNQLKAAGAPSQETSSERLITHLATVHSIKLSATDAEVILLELQSVDANPARKGGAKRTVTPPPGTQPITFLRDPFDHMEKSHNWRTENPNNTYSQFDGSRMSEAQLRQMLAGHPGDPDIYSALIAELRDNGKIEEARQVAETGWSLVAPALETMLKQDRQARLSFSHLDNRPLCRLAAGRLETLMDGESTEEKVAALKFAETIFGLMRDRDSFGLRHTILRLQGELEKWDNVAAGARKRSANEFYGMAMEAAALFHSGKHEDLDPLLKKIARQHPFAAEVMLSLRLPKWTQKMDRWISNSWQEGAHYLAQNMDIWRKDRAIRIWARVKTEIREAQEAWIREIWKTRTQYRGGVSITGYIDTLAFIMLRIRPEFGGRKPLIDSALPPPAVIPVLDLDDERLKQLTEADLQRYLVDESTHSNVKSLFVGWVFSEATKGCFEEIELIPWEDGCQVGCRAPGQEGWSTIAMLKPEYGRELWRIFGLLSGRVRWPKEENINAAFKLRDAAGRVLNCEVDETWDPAGIRILFTPAQT